MVESASTSQDIPFDLYATRLPKGLAEQTRSMLFALRDTFATRPGVASLVIAYSPVSWSFIPSSIQLHTVGEFESTFSYVNALAKLLAPVYLQHEILPLVLPHLGEQWASLSDTQPALHSNLARRGLVTYSSSRHG